MTPAQEAELTGGGDCFSHWHSEDRRATQDLLHALRSVASTTTVSSDATLRGTEDVVLADTAAGNIVLTLPSPVNGQEVTVIKTSALNTLTVEGNVLSANGSARTFKAINNQWYIISGYTP